MKKCDQVDKLNAGRQVALDNDGRLKYVRICSALQAPAMVFVDLSQE